MPKNEATVRAFLDASSLEEAMSHLAADYRLWFDRREGDGIPREQARIMLGWDFELNPSHVVSEWTHHADGSISIEAHEENDFARLLEFPGWNATQTFWFDEAGLIRSQLYEPVAEQTSYESYLERALPWLRRERAQTLERVYDEGIRAFDADSARDWKDMLEDWAQNGRPGS